MYSNVFNLSIILIMINIVLCWCELNRDAVSMLVRATVSMRLPLVQHTVIKIAALVAGICQILRFMASGASARHLQNIDEGNMIQHAVVCIQKQATLSK